MSLGDVEAEAVSSGWLQLASPAGGRRNPLRISSSRCTGSDFTFVGQQRRLRVGDEWYRIDLLFFHRRLRCLVIIDLKIGKFTHADAGRMHLYLNYAREHWTLAGESPPVGLILCAEKDNAVAKYAPEGLPNKVRAAEPPVKRGEAGETTGDAERAYAAQPPRAGEREVDLGHEAGNIPPVVATDSYRHRALGHGGASCRTRRGQAGRASRKSSTSRTVDSPKRGSSRWRAATGPSSRRRARPP